MKFTNVGDAQLHTSGNAMLHNLFDVMQHEALQENCMPQLNENEEALIRVRLVASSCVVCKDDIGRSNPAVTCRACYRRSPTTWHCHVSCWRDWHQGTCFFCNKILLQPSQRRRRRRNAAARLLKRSHFIQLVHAEARVKFRVRKLLARAYFQ
jgi:hypothetical protein